MAVTGRDQFSVGDVVLVSDLSSSQGQSPHPVVGVISSFVNPLHAQAMITYGAGRTVDRPLQLLVKLVSAGEQIPEQGLLFDPFIQGDIEQEEERREGDVQAPAHAPAQLDAQLQEQQQQHDTALGGGRTVEGEVAQTMLQEHANGGEHSEQKEMEDAEDGVGEDGEEKQSEEMQEGDHATASAETLIARQGWQGGRQHPMRVRKKVNKFA